MLWLLNETTLGAMTAAHPLTSAQIAHAAADFSGGAGNADRVLTVSGDTATITIAGVMTSQPDFMAYYFGGGNVLYGDIAAAVNAVESSAVIKSCDFVFASGGGEAQPVVGVGDMIAAMKKPTRAVVTTAGSAAYWLASQTDEIVAVNRGSAFGSIGAVTSARKPSESAYVDIASTNAPEKRPDPETEEGKASIRTFVDQFADLFATAVAVGRDKSTETVNNDFGRGGMMLAEQALAVGMIDAIGAASPQNKPKSTNTGATTMDLATLQAQHPALYAQVLADGHKQGVDKERDRVKYHSLMGQKTGATATALAACQNGTAKDDTECQVEYMTFGRNKADLDARTDDESNLADNAPGAADKATAEAAAVKNIFERVGA